VPVRAGRWPEVVAALVNATAVTLMLAAGLYDLHLWLVLDQPFDSPLTATNQLYAFSFAHPPILLAVGLFTAAVASRASRLVVLAWGLVIGHLFLA
jgi:hypothetical protein